MRKLLLLAVLAVLTMTTQPARAQFCPGVSPWVFSDVSAADPFCGYITWMAQNGISLGCAVVDANHRLYCPIDAVNRSQMAAFLNRLGNVRVEAVGTGPGLTGGPITGIGTINLANTQLLPTVACTNGQIARWNGSAWACSSDLNSGGTVTSVGSGTGLTGGPVTSTGALSIATGYQLPQGCTNGQVAKSNGSGGWTCAADNAGGGVNAVTASAPLSSSGGATPNISLIGGAAGQVLTGTGGTPTWSSSPTFSGNLYVQGGSLLGPNVGIGTNDPQAIVHIQQSANPLPPRVETLGANGFSAGWDFYRNGSAKGYVGVPDPAAPFGASELIVYGAAGTPISLWGGQTRALTVSGGGTGNIGIGTPPSSTSRLTVQSPTAIGVAGYGVTGVYGQGNVASQTQAGVYGYNTASGGIGVAGAADTGSATGVFGTSSSPTGFGMYARNNAGGKALFVDGPASQGLPYGGLAKAMIYIDRAGSIVRCFNGVTGSSTVPCGFSVTHPVIGNYVVDFGMKIDDRYIMHQTVLEGPAVHTYIDWFPNPNTASFGAYYHNSAGTLIPSDLKFHAIVF